MKNWVAVLAAGENGKGLSCSREARQMEEVAELFLGTCLSGALPSDASHSARVRRRVEDALRKLDPEAGFSTILFFAEFLGVKTE